MFDPSRAEILSKTFGTLTETMLNPLTFWTSSVSFKLTVNLELFVLNSGTWSLDAILERRVLAFILFFLQLFFHDLILETNYTIFLITHKLVNDPGDLIGVANVQN